MFKKYFEMNIALYLFFLCCCGWNICYIIFVDCVENTHYVFNFLESPFSVVIMPKFLGTNRI
jgi:hypothetical protein